MTQPYQDLVDRARRDPDAGNGRAAALIAGAEAAAVGQLSCPFRASEPALQVAWLEGALIGLRRRAANAVRLVERSDGRSDERRAGFIHLSAPKE